MAAATGGSSPGIAFDDPTFRDLEVPPDIAQRPYPAARPRGGHTLLVVDADEDTRGRVASVFHERGYQVFQAERGDAALQTVRDHDPDVILLEATLPGVHGFEVARQLKSSDRYRDIRIIMTSELYRGWRIAQDLKNTYGVDAFVEKPFKIDDIVHEVERLRSGSPHSERETSAEAEPYLQAGIAAYKAGNLEEAVAQLRTGTRVDPLAYKVHFHLGLLYGKAGQLFDGIQELETSLSIRADFFPALKNLAVLYQNAGFRNKAIEMWERCLAAAPDHDTRETIKRLLMAVL
jgi:DNA-binding response OmpR family regulator